MKTKQIGEAEGTRTFVVVFDAGDRVPDGLLEFAREEGIRGASFTAIGAFRQATLGFFDLDRKDYHEIPVGEQAEVLSLAGNIGTHGDDTKVHAHVVLGTRDGAARGGHLLDATVRPTLEVVVREVAAPLVRRIDEATGLPLLAPDARR